MRYKRRLFPLVFLFFAGIDHIQQRVVEVLVAEFFGRRRTFSLWFDGDGFDAFVAFVFKRVSPFLFHPF